METRTKTAPTQYKKQDHIFSWILISIYIIRVSGLLGRLKAYFHFTHSRTAYFSQKNYTIKKYISIRYTNTFHPSSSAASFLPCIKFLPHLTNKQLPAYFFFIIMRLTKSFSFITALCGKYKSEYKAVWSTFSHLMMKPCSRALRLLLKTSRLKAAFLNSA